MLRITPLINNIIRHNASALFISGDKAQENYAVLTPYLDIQSKLQNKERLQQNINYRKLNIDLTELHQLWSTYKDVKMRKSDLENKRVEISRLLRDLANNKESEDLIQKYKAEGVNAREDLKILKETSYALEDKFINKLLELPNDVHERTPIGEDKVYCSHFDQQITTEGENHLAKVDYVEYYDPYCYYLKNDAARCDLNLPFYCLDLFQSFGFMHFSNPDFIKSIIAEGAGLNPADLLGIEEENNKNKLNLLHLVGSGSMLSFLGFVTKLLVYKSCLPLKFVSIGKEFSVPKADTSETGLYSVSQTTNVHLFEISSNESESLQQFDETLEQMIEFYKRLEIHFRVSYVTGAKFNQAENLRVNFEMFSPFRKCYILVGHLSSYSNYISKRLLLSYKEEKLYEFPYLISGKLINVSRLIAILLEQKGEFKTPVLLKDFQ